MTVFFRKPLPALKKLFVRPARYNKRVLQTEHLPNVLPLAACPQLAGNSRLGFGASTHTLHQGFGFVISSTALGMSAPMYDSRVRSRYTGKERDTESGLDYFGARYYTSTMGRFMSPDWSAKEEPVPYSKLDNPQTLNLYSYTLNNPLSNVDTDGHACSGILGNSSSGFCTRATEYGKIDGNPAVQSQTRFFAAANAVSQSLADVDAPGSSLIGGISGKTASFLEGVGQNLQKLNESEANAIQNGSLSGPNLDQQLVHNEQSAVQGQLDGLQQSNPDAYKTTISEINGALNPGALGTFASTRFSTDKAYAGVLDGVRKDLGRNIDFSKQSDREAIGNALINHIRQTGGCDVNGKKQGGC